MAEKLMENLEEKLIPCDENGNRLACSLTQNVTIPAEAQS
jgi:hypothetical protein